MTAVRVALVDDHDIVRQGMAAVLAAEPDLLVVGSFASGEALLEGYEASAPDVVLLDLRMPGLDGQETLRQLLAKHPSAAVLVLSSHAGDEAIHTALRSGAVGYVLKSMPVEDIVGAIRSAPRRAVGIAAPVAQQLARRSLFQPLSAREVEVLRRVAYGETNKEIGAALGIAENTVKNHLNRLMEKLSVTDRTQAVMVAIQRGMITIDS